MLDADNIYGLRRKRLEIKFYDEEELFETIIIEKPKQNVKKEPRDRCSKCGRLEETCYCVC